ncbi:hypothetical protein Tco_0584888, partial [Tanacetum coccineum]
MLPLWTSNSPFSSSPKSLGDKVADDACKKTTKEPAGGDDYIRDEFERLIEQEQTADKANSTNSIYTVNTPVNVAGSFSVNVAE